MNVYEIITNRIIEQLEAGEVAWKKPWNAKTQAPRNLVSGKLYNGINTFLLVSARYQSQFWLTFKQAAERGGSVLKGEKGWPVVFWKIDKKQDEETGEEKTVPILRYYTVFNVAQIDGLQGVPATEIHSTTEDGAEAIDAAEWIVAQMPNRPQVSHGHTRACYSPAWDRVEMPVSIAFDGPAEYYSTLFHELAHATGHESRLNRHQTIKNHSFGSNDYSKEELVAEFSSAFLCAEAGISPAVLENQTAYIQGWLKALKNDSKLLINAAAQAQKAADWIMGRQLVEA